MGFVDVTGDSPASKLVAALVPTRSGLLATSAVPLEPLEPFPSAH